MYLYNCTLQKAGTITCAISGNFSSPKAQEIVIARGKILELLRPDDNGKVQTILSVEVFGIIRSLLAFRLTGSNKDHIVVGSDSGRVVILDFNPETNTFIKVHEETFGRSGCRRIVPGQYLTADPKGRAMMIAACEKQKFVYILNRDSAAKLTISSPLEAHKSHGILFDVVGVDVGFENPLFACLEFDYEDVDTDPTGEAIENLEKHLTFYELDLGLNHVARQSSEAVPKSASGLIPVPGGSDGPGGVLILCDDHIIHRSSDNEDVRCNIPQRIDVQKERSMMITSWCLVKQRDWFFFLVQSEYGDLYKIHVEHSKGAVSEIRVIYFDTVPVATTLSALKTGFLFVASETGNQFLYQFQAIGEDKDTESFTLPGDDRTFFRPRPLKNLLTIDEIPVAAPITDAIVGNLFGEETQQIYAACGRGQRSSLRILRHGVAVTERAVSTLPGVPNAVWSVKTHKSDEHDKYIIVSFKDATMVLSIGETVEEIHDSGFLATAPTLHASFFGEDSLIQIHPGGIRHIKPDKRIQEWQPPEPKRIQLCAVNSKQVTVALGGGEIIYFELDPSNRLMEIETTTFSSDITALSLAPVPEGVTRASFLAVGDAENRVRVLSLNPQDTLQGLSTQLMQHRVSSINITEMSAYGGTALYMHIGTVKGVLYRATIDRGNGTLSDTRARFVGSKPVKLFPVRVNDSEGILVISSRTWLCYNYQGLVSMTPLSYVPLEFASGFCSEQCPEGVVSIAENTLRIFLTEQTGGNMFNQTVLPLRYTPRKMLVHPITKYLIMIEGDDDTYPETEKATTLQTLKDAEDSGDLPKAMIKTEYPEEDPMPQSVFGVPHPGFGKWGSCIRILDLNRNETLDLLELENNEVAVSLAICAFFNREGEIFLIVGTAQDLVFEPKRSCSAGWIHVYSLDDNGKKMKLVHKTQVSDVPGALCEHQGRLLAGVGPILRLYELGQKKLLRKCEYKSLPNHITSLWLSQDKIIVGDIQQSFAIARYQRGENKLFILVDDPIPRWLTSGTMLDPTTIAGADKFGNVFVLRIPDNLVQQIDEDPTAGALWKNRNIAGAAYKFELLATFYVGETVTKITKTTITPGGAEVILYTTICGAIGALVPFASREDIDFFTSLEMHMRQEHKPLCGRDHLSFRSYYAPVKNVVDGDLCEQFALMTPEKQKKVSEDLERTPAEVQKKLETIRNTIS